MYLYANKLNYLMVFPCCKENKIILFLIQWNSHERGTLQAQRSAISFISAMKGILSNIGLMWR
jgi:hypothetical protein